MYSQIRSSFLSFFKVKEHTILPSSGLIPHNDPSLMFTNSGMVQFKNIFLGIEKPIFKNVTTIQKSLRAGGKHNDLDNVGYTARHHTFFEMLGNFSFTGYFKEQAIIYAWDFLTKELRLSKEKLYVTVFYNDNEAFNIWKKVLGSEDHIIKIASNDNFWMMGDSGPCGPCSEIFYDYGENVAGGKPGTADQDGDRFVEIWNLVFMQFNQQNGIQTPLLQPAIDTGMGLERLVSVLEGKTDNYDTSLFLNLRKGVADVYNCDALGKQNIACRVVSDHIRAISFLIAEGITPSNEGRGYVLRRIMRRAMRYLHQIDETQAKMHHLVNFLDAQMGADYAELRKAVPTIKDVIETEEKNFKQMLDRGLRILDEDVAKLNGNILGGDKAFKLYDTYGFPFDLTQDILRAKNISVDEIGFEKALQVQQNMSKVAWKGSGEIAQDKIWFELKEKFGETEFVGYDLEKYCGKEDFVANILNIVQNWIIFDRTIFYPEGGGQIGDSGWFKNLDNDNQTKIIDTKKMANGIIAHKIEDGNFIKLNTKVKLIVNKNNRNQIAKHHSATHLLQAALQKILGNHIAQKGSKVESTRLTFDFSHNKALILDEIEKVEKNVNDKILEELTVHIDQYMNRQKAEQYGAMALFGEKYGDVVRVVKMGGKSFEELENVSTEEIEIDKKNTASIELCGGIHVKNTGFIGSFKIISESSVGSGVRRIEAKCGDALIKYLNEQINDKNHEITKANDKQKQLNKEIEKLQIENCIATAKYSNDIIYLQTTATSVMLREAVIKVSKQYNDKIVIGTAKNENGATYIIDAGINADHVKAKKIAEEIQNNVGVTQIKAFNGKMIIFGGKFILL